MSRLLTVVGRGGRRRSGWALLAAAALAASLLSVGAGPTGAAPETADHTAEYSACVGNDALLSKKFSDVDAGSAHSTAISCLAYYGVSIGSGDGSTFTPQGGVTRRQMALFLARAAIPAGIDLGKPADQGFADVAGLPPAEQDAINSIAAAGIIEGRTAAAGGAAAEFGNDAPVTRADMALFLVRFLAKSSEFSGVALDGDGSAVKLSGEEPDSYFGDVRSVFPAGVDKAVGALYELGVTKGVNGEIGELGVFNPGGEVTRGQMASFITRTLAHTNARPRGVSIQASSKGRMQISVRDASFAPVADVRVDVFFAAIAEATRAFKADGSCNADVVSSDVGLVVCGIDLADTRVSDDGNITVPAVPVSGGAAVWAWTGSIGDTVGSGSAPFRLNLTPDDLADSEGARKVSVSYDRNGFYNDWYSQIAASDQVRIALDADGAIDPDDDKLDVRYAPYGADVTVTLQLLDRHGEPTGGSRPGKWSVEVVEYTDFADDPNVAYAAVSGERVESRKRAIQVTADSSGRGSFTIGSSDPNANNRQCVNTFPVVGTPGRGCSTVYFEISSDDPDTPSPITPDADGGITAASARNYEAADPRDEDTLAHHYYAAKTGSSSVSWVNAYKGIVVFSDLPPGDPHKITFSNLTPYSVVGGIMHTTATLVDYYGNPVKGQRLQFGSEAVRGIHYTADIDRRPVDPTDAAGRVVMPHQLAAVNADITGGTLQTVTASIRFDLSGDGDTTDTGETISESVEIVWALPESAAANANAADAVDVLSAVGGSFRVRGGIEFVAAGSVRDNQIITSTFALANATGANNDDYSYLVYDTSDEFRVAYIDSADANKLGTTKRVSLAEFEKQLAKVLSATTLDTPALAERATADNAATNSLQRAGLAWSNYSATERDQTAVFALYLPYDALSQ